DTNTDLPVVQVLLISKTLVCGDEGIKPICLSAVQQFPVWRDCSIPSQKLFAQHDSQDDVAKALACPGQIAVAFLRRVTLRLEALNGVFKNGFNLRSGYTLKPRQEVINRGSAFKVLE